MKENVFKNITWYIKHNKKLIKVQEFEKNCGVSAGFLSRSRKANSTPGIDFIIAAARQMRVSLDTLCTLDMENLGDEGIKTVCFIEKLIRDTEDEKLSWKKENNKFYSQFWPNSKVFVQSSDEETAVLVEVVKDRVFTKKLCSDKELPELKKLIKRLLNAAEFSSNHYLSDEAKSLIDDYLAGA